MCGVEMTGDLLRLDVGGVSCAACVASVEKIVGSVDSVKAVAVNLALNSASIQLNKSPTEEIVDGIIEGIVEKIGFRSTTIRKFDKSLAIIPNFQFAENAVVNVSETSNSVSYTHLTLPTKA